MVYKDIIFMISMVYKEIYLEIDKKKNKTLYESIIQNGKSHGFIGSWEVLMFLTSALSLSLCIWTPCPLVTLSHFNSSYTYGQVP